MNLRIVERIKTYMDNSSIHGFKYITERGSHWTERLFWMISCLLATYGLAELASNTYQDYLHKSIAFVVDRDWLHWNTSFPAISVCEADSELGTVSAAANRLYGEDHDLDLDTFLKEIVFFEGNCYSCEELCDNNINCTENMATLVNQVRQPCHTLFSHCSWMGLAINCCDIFKPLATEIGQCYSFNSIHVIGSSDPRNFSVNKHIGPGRLEFKVSKEVNVYMHTTEDVPFINTPQEAKETVILGSNIKIKFKVTEIVNDLLLDRLPIRRRKCRFHYENNLEVYNHYSYSGCIVDCRARAQINFCQCLHHFMPKISPFENCNISGLACLSKNSKTIGSLKTADSNKPGLVCPCIPSCTEHDHQIIETILTPYEDGNHSLIGIDMASLPKMRFRRYIVRTKLDLVVCLGGTAGLFMGVSLLSLIEWIYFMTFPRKNSLNSGTKNKIIRNDERKMKILVNSNKQKLKSIIFIPYLP